MFGASVCYTNKHRYQIEERWVKKKVLKIVGILFALLLIALVVVYFMLGTIIKKGVETVGPDLTKGDVKLGGASLSIFGSGGVKGLEIGNPKNGKFSSPFAFKLGSADVKVQVGSLMSDKIIVESILIDGAEVCFEGLNGANHQKIMDNIKEYTGEGEKTEEKPEEKKEGEGKKVVIKLFKMTNTKLHLHLLGQTIPLSLPDFEKTGIGEDSGEGASLKDTVSEIYKGLYSSLTDLVSASGDIIKNATGKAIEAISGGAESIKKGAGDAVDSIKDGAGDAIDGVKKGIDKLNPFK